MMDYKRLCGEVWDALGVAPEDQKGEPTAQVKRLMASSLHVVRCFKRRDKPGWSPVDLRNAIAELSSQVRE